ncbi:hypothetical protein HAX54_005697, partial [Datura stramonium]|nr:hypothetical protein [Datura stramonium]
VGPKDEKIEVRTKLALPCAREPHTGTRPARRDPPLAQQYACGSNISRHPAVRRVPTPAHGQARGATILVQGDWQRSK